MFVLASLFAAAGGIMAASRLLAVNQSSGGGDLLLMAIAGPVVAGVSLFGGRGSVWGALLGALVIVSISNGMDLLALDTAVKFMVTGGVLLAAGRVRRGHAEPTEHRRVSGRGKRGPLRRTGCGAGARRGTSCGRRCSGAARRA